MDISVGDRVEMKKQHPCGCKTFEILRVGMDFKIKCEKCGREVMAPRAKIEKNIKKNFDGVGYICLKKSKYLTKGTPSFPKGSTSRQ